MRILTRYVIAEYFKAFLLTLTALTTFMLLVGIVKQAYEESLGIAQILRILPFFVPEALRFSMPGSALFAACSMYGRMSGGNEIVSLKSLGISPWVVIWPVCLINLVLSLSTVWLNDMAVTWGFHGVRRVVLEAMDDIAYSRLRTQRSYSSPQFSINVKRVEGRRLIQTTISFQGHGNSPAGTIQAEEAELDVNVARGTLAIRCRNAVVDFMGEATARLPVIEREISLVEAHGSNSADSLPARMPMSELPEKAVAAAEALQSRLQQSAVKAACMMLSGENQTLVGQEWATLQTQREFQFSHLSRLRIEAPRRWANGMSCLCFMWIGAPMAIRLRNSDVLQTMFRCFLPILFAFYPLLMMGVDQGKRGALPPYCVWSGNVVLALWGCWLLRRVMRY
ncbi:MAG: LptF/LptG family permease [Pirellulales bacterium]